MHATAAPWSRLQTNVELAWEELNTMLAVVAVVLAPGAAVIVVCGGPVFTMNVCAVVSPMFPASSSCSACAV